MRTIFLLMVLSTLGYSHEFKSPWVKILPTDMTAAYVVITPSMNDQLVSAKSNRFKSIELHRSSMDKRSGKMKMKQVNSMHLKKGVDLVLKPKSYHIMIFGIKKPLRTGEKVDIKLSFKNAGEKTVSFVAKKP